MRKWTVVLLVLGALLTASPAVSDLETENAAVVICKTATALVENDAPREESLRLYQQVLLHYSTGIQHMILWSREDGITDLGTLLPGGSSSGRSVNPRGEVAGVAQYSKQGSTGHQMAVLGRRGSVGAAFPNRGYLISFCHRSC